MGGGPRFCHFDEVPSQEVRGQEHGDRQATVREQWLDVSSASCRDVRWDPGTIVQPHRYRSDHLVFMIEGERSCGDPRCPPGTDLAPNEGESLGPFIAGPDGVVLFEVMMGNPRSISADPAGYETPLARRGIEQLPSPPIARSDWLEDTRSGA